MKGVHHQYREERRDMDSIKSQRKPTTYRLKWTSELHQAFLLAIENIGCAAKATPKSIVHVMNVEGLTISHVQSHLQMYRRAIIHHNKKERRRSRRYNDDGNSDQQHADNLHPPPDPAKERHAMKQHPISNALEWNKGIEVDGMKQRDSMESFGSSLDDHANSQLKSPLMEEESPTSKNYKADDQHVTQTSILTSDEMEETHKIDECSLSLSLSLLIKGSS